jgi:hypothetical protein
LCSVKNERLATLNGIVRQVKTWDFPGKAALIELLEDIHRLWINRPCYLFID